jgi:hypothetical protein
MELYTNYVLVITDVGEECDDESALHYLSRAAATTSDLFVEVLCVGGKMEESARLARCRNCIGLEETANFKMGPVSGFPKWSHVSSRRMVLQIGPVNDEVGVSAFISGIGGPYNYILLGMLGTTNSSNGAPRHFAEQMMASATSALVVATKVNGFTRIPLFTARNAEWFPDGVYNEIMRVGFKNTLGRAPPSLASLNQLVGPGGANYETAKSITDGIMGEGSFDGLRITRAARQAAQAYGTSYNEEQIDGMARMLVAFHRLFGVPVGEVWSSSASEFSVEGLETGALSGPFQAFINQMESNPVIGMTPAYDLVAAWLAVMMAEAPWRFAQYFDIHCDDGVIYALKPTMCHPNLIHRIMEEVEEGDDEDDDDDDDEDDDDDDDDDDDEEPEPVPVGVEQISMFERWADNVIG